MIISDNEIIKKLFENQKDRVTVIIQYFRNTRPLESEILEPRLREMLANVEKALFKSIDKELSSDIKEIYEEEYKEYKDFVDWDYADDVGLLVWNDILEAMAEKTSLETDLHKEIYKNIKENDRLKKTIGKCFHFMAHLANQSRSLQEELQKGKIRQTISV